MNPEFITFSRDYIRLNQLLENSPQPPNSLVLPIYDLIEGNFAEIFHDVSLLKSCYVPQREGRGAAGMFWNERQRSWANEAESVVDTKLNLEWIEDIALRLVVRQIVSIDRSIQMWIKTEQLPSTILPTQRLLFVEGLVGSGKSTLLHYFQKLLVPSLPERTSLDFRIVPAMVNLNNVRPKAGLESARPLPIDDDQTWKEALALIRREIEITTGIKKNTDDWIRIARQDTHNELGEYLPDIQLAPNPQLAFQEIVRKSVDDLTFIRRVAHHLQHAETRSLIVLIFDNLDFHTSLPEQLFIIKKLHELLATCPLLAAMVSVRTWNRNRISRFQQQFNEFFIVRGVTINNPKIGEMVQKRFDVCLSQLRSSRDLRATVRIMENVTLSPADVTQIFSNVKSAFLVPQKPPNASRNNSTADHPAQFLQGNSNGNCREILETVKNVLTSHALLTGPVVLTYFEQKQLGYQKIALPRLKLDEVIRLVAAGNFSYYDRRKSPTIFNLFGCEDLPNLAEGRFPVLILYRFLQYFYKHEPILRSEVQNTFRCFEYTIPEMNSFLELFLKARFLETDDSRDYLEAEMFRRTDRTDYYFSSLCRNLVYLENIRNDVPINYSTTPHEIRTPIHADVPEVLKFIAFILAQEKMELDFIKTKGELGIERFRRIITREPVAIRLTASVVSRSNELLSYSKDRFGDTKEIARNLDYLKTELHRFAMEARGLYPDTLELDVNNIRFSGDGKSAPIHTLS